MADFSAKMVQAGLFKPGEIDVKRAYTLQFVNKGVSLDIKKKLAK